MLTVDELKLSITRGDTGSITVTFTGDDTPDDTTTAKVALQKTLDSEEPVWEKLLPIVSAETVIPLRTEDTDLPYGKYYWCLRLLYANGDVYTPMRRPAEFHILPVVGDTTGGESNG